MKTHTGFTLIEVLIAMLVLALGLMGLATLQTYLLRSNLSAYTRGQATQLLYDMSDKMRANTELAKKTTSSYVITNTSTDPKTAGKKVDNTHPCRITTNTTCDAAALATYDLIEWHNAIAAALPMGRGCISSANNVFVLYVTWDDNRSGTVTTDRTDLGSCSTISTYTSGDSNPDPILSMSLQL